MSDLPKITELTMTCSACPAQWEGRLDDGRFLYARYRYGRLIVSAASKLDDAIMPGMDLDSDAEVLLAKPVGGAYDGVMTHEELREHLDGILTFP